MSTGRPCVRVTSYRVRSHGGDGRWSPVQPEEGSRPRTGFPKENLAWLEGLFRGQLGSSEELHLEDFQKIIQTKNPFFAERVFQIFDRDGSGTVSLQEFIDAMHQFAGQSHDDKIRFLFKVYDLDGDGLIQHRELQHVMHACMEENGMKFSDEQIEDLTSALFEDADVQGHGTITYEALKAQLEKHEGLLENLSISIDRWLVPPQPRRGLSFLRQLTSVRPYQFSLPYIRNNYTYLAFLFAFLAVNVGLFVSRCVQFRGLPGFYVLARACGQTLNFTCAFIIAVMLRNVITFARSHGLGSFLPLDEHIYFHKMAGMFVFVYSVVHTFAHLCNLALNVVPPDGPLSALNSGNFTYAEWLLTMRPRRFGLVPGLANPSGVALMLILAVMVICSQPFVRKRGNFEVFYWTHLLYVPFFALLILHAPNFWKWVILPGVIYVVERAVRFVRTRMGHGRAFISSGILLPSKVTHLVIKRPANLDYHPGDYIFVNIPVIAKYEWHPFTISSAPEQHDTLWLHIRAAGGWTNRLYDYFEEEQLKIECLEEIMDGDDCNSDKGQQVPKQEESSLQKIQKSMKKLAKPVDKDRRISFSTKPPEILSGGTENGAYTGNQDVSMEPIDEEDQQNGDGDRVAACGGPENGHPFTNRRVPLLKTISLPDMDYRVKKRQKLLLLRGQIRSSSERTFDDKTMQNAHNQLANLPYLSPQNKSVAHSFRYMRRKPTIIAFKTPSLDSLGAAARPERPRSDPGQAEEGHAPTTAPPSGTELRYPVGKPLEIYFDGPYGAPSSHIFRAQHAVLIGTGIGVTPFASILQSIMHRYWKNCHRCPRCQHKWTDELPASVMNLKKVDFFWINRDQRSFEWFVNLLSQLEIEQAELGGVMDRFLDMHMYITSALQKTDMKAVGLQLALDLLHEKEKRDMITGLKTRTIAGRPNWNKVFRQIQEQRKGKVTVFFCGPPQLSRIVRHKCDEFGFEFRKENF
ncbi:LOW QUALITY PROTEIN: NADPH oxidase 5-like [Pollicipes pollicipes]|uniref:LOW QUALITY PROTEIN: NADPH oxidase 5-like n=1 Tax=Pollicipes pollicipes TaxID=41117 RepID=UPI001885260D|nr:LOW QUALITY PROTEIN: NADPH oxidase 5-like [Pollicipes pollicipes]